ncbi:aspartate-semialdehyde dehydrogenase [Halobacteriovorax sp. XZX-3]|uniref:aspartate-semialdehyde dehydrogenase n=1 Tax=unclassified Halobacteriovorax TaxID=2639665 RepID=UPI00371B69B0
MKKVGIIGWRGMVGSVLLERMESEGDFAKIDPYFFSTSQAGQSGPLIYNATHTLKDANNISELADMDIIISCQGGDYTKQVRPELEKVNWPGFWIDAASAKRMDDDSLIILDPVNRDIIDKALNDGIKNFVGGNCTVSLMLMGIGSLFQEGLVEWMSTMSYQAASGGGARHMKELLKQMGVIGNMATPLMDGPILQLDQDISNLLKSNELDSDCFGVPLALNLIPWIDSAVEGGQTREEWKAFSETNKILGRTQNPIPIDGTCVRVGALRSHSQALTVKLNKSVDLKTIEEMIKNFSEYTEFVENTPEATREKLNPRYVSGTLKTTVGRVRKMKMGDDYLNIFTSGDQLLWGAAEPLRRMLNIVL